MTMTKILASVNVGKSRRSKVGDAGGRSLQSQRIYVEEGCGSSEKDLEVKVLCCLVMRALEAASELRSSALARLY